MIFVFEVMIEVNFAGTKYKNHFTVGFVLFTIREFFRNMNKLFLIQINITFYFC